MRSVRTTFRILEAIARDQPTGLSELARGLQMPKSTVQRSVATLADLNWIRPAGHGQWELGERVRTLSDQVDDVGRLREAAMSEMDVLNGQTRETVHLAIPESGTVRLVERIESKHAFRLVEPIGSRGPLHASSTGKSILAHFSEVEITGYIDAGLVSYTTRTIVNPTDLRADLARTRERGFAFCGEERLDGIVSVGASIRPRGGRPVGAISVSGPVSRMGSPQWETFGELVARAAAEAAKRLGD